MLKRLLDQVDDSNDVILLRVEKRSKSTLSLSRSRSRDSSQYTTSQASQSSQSSQHSQSVTTKIEDSTALFSSSNIPSTTTEDNNNSDNAFQLHPFQKKARSVSTLEYKQEESEEKNHIHKDVLLDIKNDEASENLASDLFIKQQSPEPKSKENVDTKQEDAIKPTLQSVPVNSISTSSNTTQPDTDSSETYTCFICNEDLTHIKYTYFRQKHIDKCLDNMNKTAAAAAADAADAPSFLPDEPIVSEFSMCCFCQKDMAHFKPNQRLVHLNRCLDEQASLIIDDLSDTTTASATTTTTSSVAKEDTFAGQTNSFIRTLEICPVCHDATPVKDKTIKQKLLHAKQCAKQHKLNANTLIMRFQWIRWGHIPTISTKQQRIANAEGKEEEEEEEKASVRLEKIPPHTTTTTTPSITKSIRYDLQAYIPPSLSSHNDAYTISDETDHDFDDTVIIHKQARQTKKQLKLIDKADEEFQTVLALSKSLHQVERNSKQQRKKPLNERDWNAANIWSIEESKKRAVTKMNDLLFPPDQTLQALKQAERERSRVLLSVSRLLASTMTAGTTTKLKDRNDSSMRTFYWNLASFKDKDWSNNPSVFTSLFMQKE